MSTEDGDDGAPPLRQRSLHADDDAPGRGGDTGAVGLLEPEPVCESGLTPAKMMDSIDIMEDSGFTDGTLPLGDSAVHDLHPFPLDVGDVKDDTAAAEEAEALGGSQSSHLRKARSVPGLKPLVRPEKQGAFNGGVQEKDISSPSKLQSPGLRHLSPLKSRQSLGQPGRLSALSTPFGDDVSPRDPMAMSEITVAESGDNESDKGSTTKANSIFNLLGTELDSETRSACARVSCLLILGVPLVVTTFACIFGALFAASDHDIDFEDGFFIAATILTGASAPLGGNATSPTHDGSRTLAIVCGTWSMGIFGILVVLFSAPAMDPIFGLLRLR